MSPGTIKTVPLHQSPEKAGCRGSLTRVREALLARSHRTLAWASESARKPNRSISTCLVSSWLCAARACNGGYKTPPMLFPGCSPPWQQLRHDFVRVQIVGITRQQHLQSLFRNRILAGWPAGAASVMQYPILGGWVGRKRRKV